MEQDDAGIPMETGRTEMSGTERIGERSGGTLADYSELVDGVAARVTAFQSGLQADLDVSTTEDPNYYHAYPFLFRDEFPGVTDAEASTLAVAGVFYLNHLCLLDDVVDSQKPQSYKLFLSALLHEEALIQLGTLFAAGSPFWAELSAYHREFAAAMLREQTAHTDRTAAYTEAEVFQIAKGKAALAKMTTAALALLAKRPEAIASLSASQDCFNAARQMYDDVKDWKDDYLHRRYSSVLTAALLDGGGDAGDHDAGALDTETLSARLHYGGHIDRALEQAAQWCDEAAGHVAGLRVEGWRRLIHSLRAQVVRLRGDLATLREGASSTGAVEEIHAEGKPA